MFVSGDDAIELYEQGVVIETFGDIVYNQSYTVDSLEWAYKDSWAYKVDGEWTYGGLNCSENSLFYESTCLYPLCDGIPVLGCMDNGLEANGVGLVTDYNGDGLPAYNYNPFATEELGTCITVIYGCTTQGADNYDSNANTNDGSCAFEQPNPLFISEYAEGSGYNKYVEIYNSSDSDVDLTNYELWGINNGGTWPESVLELTGSIAPGDVFVVAYCGNGNNCSDELILAEADMQTNSSTMNFNGDDALGLAFNGILIDAIGEDGDDPGSGFSLPGGDTKDNTLVRNCDVTIGSDWSVSSSEESSQWTVLPKDNWDGLGAHEVCGVSDPCADVVCEEGFECLDEIVLR